MITRRAVYAQCTRALDPVLSPAYARREADRAHRAFLRQLRASVYGMARRRQTDESENVPIHKRG